MNTTTVQQTQTSIGVFEKVFGPLSQWAIFERSWLIVFTIINLALFFLTDGSILGFIASMTGMLAVVLVAKGRISNYFFGIIQVSVYGYLAYTYSLFGEAMLNILFYLPTQFIGLYLWSRNKVSKEESTTGEQVEVKRLTGKQWVGLSVLTVSSVIFYALLLKNIGGASVGLDSITTVLSVIAQILMLKRYAEQWIMWIVINVLSIIMWLVVLLAQEGNDWSMLVMWSAFLFNSIYGYINWVKMGKKQEVTNV